MRPAQTFNHAKPVVPMPTGKPAIPPPTGTQVDNSLPTFFAMTGTHSTLLYDKTLNKHFDINNDITPDPTTPVGQHKVPQGQCDQHKPNLKTSGGGDHPASTEQHPERPQIDTPTDNRVSPSPLAIDLTASCQAIQALPVGGTAEASYTP
jgi:hypothetical protein